MDYLDHNLRHSSPIYLKIMWAIAISEIFLAMKQAAAGLAQRSDCGGLKCASETSNISNNSRKKHNPVQPKSIPLMSILGVENGV